MSGCALSISAKKRMAELLRVKNLSAGYGDARVIQGLSFALEDGQSLALLGRNGVGKTTLIDSLIGVTRRFAGRIELAGEDIAPLPAHLRARRGVGWTPQERNIFRSLTVEENLTAVAIAGPWTVTRVYALFPRLEERRRAMGRQLSGGEQQMLAVGRALVLNPRLLLLDEPTEGLAPIIVDELLAALRQLARAGLSMIIVEQKPKKILPFTDHAIVLDRGAIAHAAPSAELLTDPATLDAHLTATKKAAR
jgi:branched-chain amino acid transport system ATP-binding protein